jgi:hypothetical protein
VHHKRLVWSLVIIELESRARWLMFLNVSASAHVWRL